MQCDIHKSEQLLTLNIERVGISKIRVHMKTIKDPNKYRMSHYQSTI